MGELGMVAAQGREGLKTLLAIIAKGADERLPVDARASLIVLAAQLEALQTMIGAIEKRIVAQHRAHEASKRLASIPGIGSGRKRDHGHCYGLERIPVGSRFCGLDRAGASTRFDWRQTEAWADFQAGRPDTCGASVRRRLRRSARAAGLPP
jgi:hypothetical protein